MTAYHVVQLQHQVPRGAVQRPSARMVATRPSPPVFAPRTGGDHLFGWLLPLDAAGLAGCRNGVAGAPAATPLTASSRTLASIATTLTSLPTVEPRCDQRMSNRCNAAHTTPAETAAAEHARSRHWGGPGRGRTTSTGRRRRGHRPVLYVTPRCGCAAPGLHPLTSDGHRWCPPQNTS